MIIFGTGFHVTDPPIAGRLRGRDGRTLAECWNGRPHTYLGVTVTNFPNLFRLGGAGSTTGHNSHVFQEECQVAYAMDALRLMRSRGIASIEVRADDQRAYIAAVHGAAGGHGLVGRRLQELVPGRRRGRLGHLARLDPGVPPRDPPLRSRSVHASGLPRSQPQRSDTRHEGLIMSSIARDRVT